MLYTFITTIYFNFDSALTILFIRQKRKALRASIITQRRMQSNGLNDPATVSLTVDTVARSNTESRSPGRAWPGDSDLRQRPILRSEDIRLTPAAYTANVSHLIV